MRRGTNNSSPNLSLEFSAAARLGMPSSSGEPGEDERPESSTTTNLLTPSSEPNTSSDGSLIERQASPENGSES